MKQSELIQIAAIALIGYFGYKYFIKKAVQLPLLTGAPVVVGVRG